METHMFGAGNEGAAKKRREAQDAIRAKREREKRAKERADREGDK